MEEERRLAYVGITRAKRQLYISHSANRMMHGLWMSSFPSRFLKEFSRKRRKEYELNLTIIEDLNVNIHISENISEKKEEGEDEEEEEEGGDEEEVIDEIN